MLSLIRLLILTALIGWFGYHLGPAVIETPHYILAIAVGGLLLIVALTRFDYALMFLLFIIPFSVQANVGSLANYAPVDFGVDDFFIICLIFTWLAYLAKTRKSPYVDNPLTWPFFAYLFACVLSFLPMLLMGKGNITLSALHLVKWYEYVFLYFVIVRTLETQQQVQKFAYLMIGSSLLVCAVHLMQIIYAFGFSPEPGEYLRTAVVTFKSSGILGAFYVLFVAILASFLLQVKTARMKLILAGICGLMSLTIFYTYSRAAFLGYIVSIIVLGLLRRKMYFFTGLLLISLIPALLSKNVKANLEETIHVDRKQIAKMGLYRNYSFHYAATHTKDFYLDPSSMERLRSWTKAKKIISDNFIFGIGYWGARLIGAFGFFTVHNTYLTILMETGLPGIGSFVWLCIAILYGCIRFGKESRNSFNQTLAYGLAAGFSGVLVHSIFGETFEDFRLCGPLWILCGVVFAAQRIERDSRASMSIQHHATAA